MKKSIVVLVLLFVCQFVIAQEYEFGKVRKGQLKEQYYLEDSSSTAAFLYKGIETYFLNPEDEKSWLVASYFDRIKFYNQQGFKYAHKKIKLFKSKAGNDEFLEFKAKAYSLIDNEIKIEEFNLSDLEIINETRTYIEFMLKIPNLEEGSVLDLQYAVKMPSSFNAREFDLQYEIPIKEFSAVFMPSNFVKQEVMPIGDVKKLSYKPTASNVNFIDPTRGWVDMSLQEKEYWSNVTWFSDASPQFRLSMDNPRNTIQNFQVKGRDFKYINIPALEKVDYVNNLKNFNPSLLLVLGETPSWEEVVKRIYNSPEFLGELEKTDYFKSDIDSIKALEENIKTRMEHIYEFVKSKVACNGKYGVYTSKDLNDVYLEGKGNVADINLMLSAMLRYSGFEANPVLVTTRDNGFPLCPNYNAFNYVITKVNLPTEDVLLDASEKYAAPNVLPLHAKNWLGFSLKEDGSIEKIYLYPEKHAVNNTIMKVKIDEVGNIQGVYRNMRSNQFALDFRNNNKGVGEKEYLRLLASDFGGIEITDYKLLNKVEYNKPVSETFMFKRDSCVGISQDKMFVSPLFFLTSFEKYFKEDSRSFPIDFGTPFISKYHVNIEIPERYRVKILPEPVIEELPDGLGFYKYDISSSKNSIVFSSIISINRSVVAKEYFSRIKSFYRNMFEKQLEQIVLVKKIE